MNSDSNPLLKIKAIFNDFTPVEQKVAEFILENPSKVPAMSIKELAVASKSSDASVLRFCKALGFSGYRNFIVGLTLAIADNEADTGLYTDIRPGDSVKSVVRNIFRNERQALTDTENILKTTEVEKAVAILGSSEAVHFFGIGASGLVCLDAVQKFRRIGVSAYTHTDFHDQLTSAALLGSKDACVLFTYSGKTKEIQLILKLLKAQNCKIIAVTQLRKTNLLKGADVYLNVLTREVTMRSGATSSRIAMLSIVDILLSCVLSTDYDKYEKKLLKTYEALHTGDTIMSENEIMKLNS
jgi:uncharacterized HTH-type transcriptional regulator CA_C0191